MTNIVPFRPRAVSLRASLTTADEEAVVVAATGAGRLEAPRRGVTGSRDDLRRTVLLLDLALQHARELAELVTDERMRGLFDRHLASIEYSLQIARERMAAST
ncbi:conserved protein of unknown function [Bradyrhizobium sp. ORS 285]|uniref:hypothetical protein n=1 Tax=Bradyrhizobium sp. ORS 285 TaxID=115808 RepID=UPI000240783D|nr:hypothetical protein [Bradyrhizobium sp. ORS 285]CCD84420.1 conserved hypothetical protein [Bradyrhizobium sp. ORS 285]SMX57063.1 conserved protein of unknown function [Bradyrhizobium sp. ORS 285]